MKHLFLITASLLGLWAGAQKKENIYSGYVKYDGAPSAGTITVSSTGFGKKGDQTLKDAEYNAFYALLFRGIPGSQYELPMIANESEKKDNSVVKSLLNGGYKSYVTEATLQDVDIKTKKEDGKKGKATTYKITINCDALRRHLETNGVIRKFGI